MDKHKLSAIIFNSCPEHLSPAVTFDVANYAYEGGLDKLIAEVERETRESLLAEVLPTVSFYADKSNWRVSLFAVITPHSSADCIKDDEDGEPYADGSGHNPRGGRRARALLSKLQAKADMTAFVGALETKPMKNEV